MTRRKGNGSFTVAVDSSQVAQTQWSRTSTAPYCSAHDLDLVEKVSAVDLTALDNQTVGLVDLPLFDALTYHPFGIRRRAWTAQERAVAKGLLPRDASLRKKKKKETLDCATTALFTIPKHSPLRGEIFTAKMITQSAKESPPGAPLSTTGPSSWSTPDPGFQTVVESAKRGQIRALSSSPLQSSDVRPTYAPARRGGPVCEVDGQISRLPSVYLSRYPGLAPPLPRSFEPQKSTPLLRLTKSGAKFDPQIAKMLHVLTCHVAEEGEFEDRRYPPPLTAPDGPRVTHPRCDLQVQTSRKLGPFLVPVDVHSNTPSPSTSGPTVSSRPRVSVNIDEATRLPHVA